MKRLLLSALLLLPMSVFASHMDVIEFELVEGCSFSKYMEIVGDFNQWGAGHGYNAQIATPLQSANLTSYFWLGSSDSAASFGKAWDTWRDALGDPASEPSKLSVRFQECSNNLSRRSYDIY